MRPRPSRSLEATDTEVEVEAEAVPAKSSAISSTCGLACTTGTGTLTWTGVRLHATKNSSNSMCNANCTKMRITCNKADFSWAVCQTLTADPQNTNSFHSLPNIFAKKRCMFIVLVDASPLGTYPISSRKCVFHCCDGRIFYTQEQRCVDDFFLNCVGAKAYPNFPQLLIRKLETIDLNLLNATTN